MYHSRYFLRLAFLDTPGVLFNGLIFYLLFTNRSNPSGRPSDLFTLAIALVDVLYILIFDAVVILGFERGEEGWERYFSHIPHYALSLLPQILLLCRTYCHYLAICHPFKFREYVTKRNVSRTTTTAAVLVVLLAVMKSFIHAPPEWTPVLIVFIKMAELYTMLEFLVLFAEFVLLILFTSVCCWAVFSIYLQKRSDAKLAEARAKKISSNSVGDPIGFQRRRKGSVPSLPCQGHSLMASSSSSRDTHSNVCFAIVHEDIKTGNSSRASSIPHWSAIMTTNNPIGGRQQSSDSSLPNLKATDESIIRLGSPQKEEVILPIEQVLEGRHEYKHGSLMGRMCQKPFTKKNSASPNMVAPSRDDFNLESARIDRHLSSSTNKINTKWKQRKYMRIIVNLILIQMPFILLRMPKYIHENGWIILHDSNSIGTSLKSTSSLLTELHISFYCFNAVLAYMTSSQLRKLIIAWAAKRKQCLTNIRMCCSFSEA
ncbi:uncharacterized protein LOC134842221 [Symsagittifera roscoffensis]|uniref:uncharacterized protein LOC134842221 n=1 Tax=Symsagittifera roscoffensis TaxID=84072 RepID=UPI00307BCA2E